MAYYKQLMEAERDADIRSQWADRIDQWNKALKVVAGLKGVDAKGWREAELIQDIVEEIKRRLHPLPQDLIHPEKKDPNHPEIPLQVIKNCTQDFSEINFIGKGGYGRVYRGFLTWGNHVDQLDKIIDPRIGKDIKPTALLKFSSIAYQCLQETREERPTIAEVAFQLEEAMRIQLEDEIL
ncbi:hypothetical protein L2E82_28979 [Cichorium intybus]|uniref:Uncharacterized protein n=1 Tax=Cichorium intybus TaxID=13427 RepID=A0ACB9CX37_CICIN|nr:hypothetical protein L2E82_28979 [Cichorium intybus]